MVFIRSTKFLKLPAQPSNKESLIRRYYEPSEQAMYLDIDFGTVVRYETSSRHFLTTMMMMSDGHAQFAHLHQSFPCFVMEQLSSDSWK